MVATRAYRETAYALCLDHATDWDRCDVLGRLDAYAAGLTQQSAKKKRQAVLCPHCGARSTVDNRMGGMEMRVCKTGHTFIRDERKFLQVEPTSPERMQELVHPHADDEHSVDERVASIARELLGFDTRGAGPELRAVSPALLHSALVLAYSAGQLADAAKKRGDK